MSEPTRAEIQTFREAWQRADAAGIKGRRVEAALRVVFAEHDHEVAARALVIEADSRAWKQLGFDAYDVHTIRHRLMGRALSWRRTVKPMTEEGGGRAMSERDEYMPTTDEIVSAASCSYGGHFFDQIVEDDELGYREVPVYAACAVRRWLAAHDAEVAAAEREVCAEIADDEWGKLAELGEWSDGAQVASMNIARRIRARGEGSETR